MIKKSLPVLFVAMFGLLGCSVSTIQPMSPIHEYNKSYNLGEPQTSLKDSPLLTIHNVRFTPVYKARYTYQPPRAGSWPVPPITPDQKWVVHYSANNHYIIKSRDYLPWLGIEITPEGEIPFYQKPWINLTGLSRTGIPVTRLEQDYWNPPDLRLFSPTMSDHEDGSFRAVLFYRGKVGDNVILSYQEYVDDMDHPVSQQDFRYDLSRTNEILFRTLKIRVLQATDSEIMFQVAEDDSLPWVPKE